MDRKCSIPQSARFVFLSFISVAGIFGFISLIFYLNHRNYIGTQCQSFNISVTLETCYVAESIWIRTYPYTGRVQFRFPVFTGYKNITIYHWETMSCGITSEQLIADLSSQYPLRNYTPCWYWNDSNTNGYGGSYPLYWQEIYANSGILFIVTCICLGIATIMPMLCILGRYVKNRSYDNR